MLLENIVGHTPFPEKCRRLWNRVSRHPRLSAAALSLLLLAIVFPDVIFCGASFVINDQLAADAAGLHGRWFYPLPHHYWWASYSDDGGALWQSEPMMEFIRYCVRTLNSPYWNPFSGAGSLGPETLVDMKFSVFTWAYALLGGGSLVYNLLTLFMYGFACYCLIRIVRDELGLSPLAAFAAGGFYLLNGYATANIATNYFLSYLFIPLCLYASFIYAKAPSVRRWAVLSLSFVPLLSCSFFPTTIVALAVIFCLIAGYVFSIAEKPAWRRLCTVFAAHFFAMLAAAGVLAIFYLPFFESLSQSGIFGLYQQRKFFPVYLTGVFSLFTPSHFFESYNVMEAGAASFFSDGSTVTGNTVYHFGFVGLCLAAGAVTLRGNRWRWLIIACLMTIGLTLGRLFAVPGIMQIVGHLPVLRNLGCQYLWGGVAVPLVFLVALGVENVRKNRPALKPVAAMLAVAVVGAVYVGMVYGLHQPHIFLKIIFLLMDAGFAALIIAALWTRWQLRINRPAWTTASLLVVMLFVELIIDGKQLREPAMNVFTSPPASVTYLREHIGQRRTMNISGFGLVGENASAYQIQEVTSLNDGTFPAYVKFFGKAVQPGPGQGWDGFISLSRITDTPDKSHFNWPLIDFLGVKYVLLPIDYSAYAKWLQAEGLRLVATFPPIQIFENPHALPHAFTVEAGADPAAQDIDLPEGVRDHLSPAAIVSYRNASVDIRGVAAAPRLLVLTDNWHPNWGATLNGKPVPILKVDGTFRGVWLPKGSFEVRMTYRPRTLTAAIIISLLSFAGLAGIALCPLRFRRRLRVIHE